MLTVKCILFKYRTSHNLNICTSNVVTVQERGIGMFLAKNLFNLVNIIFVCEDHPRALLFSVGQGCQEYVVYFSNITLNSLMSLHPVGGREEGRKGRRG